MPLEQIPTISTTPACQKAAKPKKNRERPIQRYRLAVQIGFAALCVWIGVEFYYFVRYLESGGVAAFVERPPGVDGFLPISSLMSLYYFLLSGQVHWAHPAGLFILVAIITVSWVFGKASCSWLCPVGLLSELLGDIGEKLNRGRLAPPRWLDYPLRGLKYVLLGFFVWAIFFAMTGPALRAFLDSPYNIVADIKMYYFFADISRFALIVLAALFVLSIVIRNFWCRYLCPYGALLGIVGLLSPTRIKRIAVSCIDCGKCAKVCPSRVRVDRVRAVVSDECTSCLQCVDVCPVADTLRVQTTVGRARVPKTLIAAGVVGLFVLITGLGVISGHWQNRVSGEEYLRHQEQLHAYGHPTSSDDISELNDETAGADGSPSETKGNNHE